MTDEDMKKFAEQYAHARALQATPIDFAALVEQGALRHVKGNKYELLVPIGELPEHARAQVTTLETARSRDGSSRNFLTFSRRRGR